MDLAVERHHAAIVPLLNPATAAQLASASSSQSTFRSLQSFHDQANLGQGTTAAANPDHLEHLIGDLRLRESVDAPCPYCNIDISSCVNANGTVKALLSRSGSRDSTTSSSSAATAAATEGIPGLFLCPLSRRVLKDPVVACDGFTYDKRAIQEHFETGDRTSPLTKQQLRSTAVLPNHSIRAAVNEWLDWRDRRIKHLLRQQQRQQQQQQQQR